MKTTTTTSHSTYADYEQLQVERGGETVLTIECSGRAPADTYSAPWVTIDTMIAARPSGRRRYTAAEAAAVATVLGRWLKTLDLTDGTTSKADRGRIECAIADVKPMVDRARTDPNADSTGARSCCADIARALFAEREVMLAERARRKDVEAELGRIKLDDETRLETGRDDRELRRRATAMLAEAEHRCDDLIHERTVHQRQLRGRAATIELQADAIVRLQEEHTKLLADIDQLERLVLYDYDEAAYVRASARIGAEHKPAWPEGIPRHFIIELAKRRHHTLWSAVHIESQTQEPDRTEDNDNNP